MRPATFVDDPASPGLRVWRRSGAPAIVSGAACALFILLALGLWTWAPTLGDETLAWPLFATGLVILAFAALMWRDMIGKRGARIVFDADSATFSLPRGRSLIHRPPAVRSRIRFADMVAVETRLEAYGSLMRQRTYRLVPRDGPPIFLFEDRAVGTRMATPSLRAVAEEIASRAGLELTELPAAEGRAGLLGAWFASPPAWSDAGMTDTRKHILATRARWIWTFLVLLCLMAWLSTFL